MSASPLALLFHRVCIHYSKWGSAKTAYLGRFSRTIAYLREPLEKLDTTYATPQGNKAVS